VLLELAALSQKISEKGIISNVTNLTGKMTIQLKCGRRRCNTLQCYLDFGILTVCNHWHVLSDKGFLNEHTLNYEYQQMDNIAIFYIYITDKQKNQNKKWASVSVSIHFWSHFNCHTKHFNNIEEKKKCSISNEKNVSKCKSNDKIVQLARLSTFHPPSKKPETKNGRI